MLTTDKEMGFLVLKDFFQKDELNSLQHVILDFHASWKQKNADFYNKRAINSAYLTGNMHLDDFQRIRLFQFIAGSHLMSLVDRLFASRAAFMNTQLFFDPVDAHQKMSAEDRRYRNCSIFHEKVIRKVALKNN